jgi:hypothetical protein
VHLLSALDTSTGIVLAQVTVSAKSNEIPAFAPLLDALEHLLGSLKDLISVADALHTQVNHVTAEIAALRASTSMAVLVVIGPSCLSLGSGPGQAWDTPCGLQRTARLHQLHQQAGIWVLT